jgi:hypothetical protein
MSTATTTEPQTGQTSSRRTANQPTNTPVTQTTPNAAQRLRTTMAAVKLAFTWLGVRASPDGKMGTGANFRYSYRAGFARRSRPA